MAEQTPRSLNHFALYAFKDAYWSLDLAERDAFHKAWLGGLRSAAPCVQVYQAVDDHADLLVWCALASDDPQAAAAFFEKLARATIPFRRLIQPGVSLWGFTRPSQYTRTRSAQEMDAWDPQRKRYLVIYPFIKTVEWYLMSREVRQGMMNEHIRIGKQYEDIQQLLLYSFGLQDQEFVVVYETDDLIRFSDLVNELRSSEARRYTRRDTPLHTAIYHPAEETLSIWK